YIPAQAVGNEFIPLKGFQRKPVGWNVGVDSAVTPGSKGYLLAWDPVAQKEVWRVNHAGPWNGGVLTTAGNIVVQGDASGQFGVYRADTGQRLWSTSAQTGVIAAPIAYEVN